MYITGIGSRKAPNAALNRVKPIADYLCSIGVNLRSGGALGMDEEWQKQFTINKQGSLIFYPRQSYNRIKFLKNGEKRISVYGIRDCDWTEAKEIARTFHHKWNDLSPFVKCLMARNVFQILDLSFKPISKCVLCWTPDGANGTTIKTSRKTGGTGLAIRIAVNYGIPVFNMNSMTNKQIIKELKNLL